MDLDSIAKVTRGEYCILRFRGQTVIYLPLSMGDAIPSEAWTRVAQSYFQEEELGTDLPKVYRWVEDLPNFYEITLPSVFNRYNPNISSSTQPEWQLPELFMQRILQKDY